MPSSYQCCYSITTKTVLWCYPMLWHQPVLWCKLCWTENQHSKYISISPGNSSGAFARILHDIISRAGGETRGAGRESIMKSAALSRTLSFEMKEMLYRWWEKSSTLMMMRFVIITHPKAKIRKCGHYQQKEFHIVVRNDNHHHHHHWFHKKWPEELRRYAPTKV